MYKSDGDVLLYTLSYHPEDLGIGRYRLQRMRYVVCHPTRDVTMRQLSEKEQAGCSWPCWSVVCVLCG
jgi:hypothetical protein